LHEKFALFSNQSQKKSFFFNFEVPFVVGQEELWEVALHITPSSKKYDLLRDNVVWAKDGRNGKKYVLVKGNIKFEFLPTQDRNQNWRSNLTEGQLPSLMFWPL